MALRPSNAPEPAQARAGAVFLAVVAVAAALVAAGLSLTGVSAEALRNGDSVRGLLDRLVRGDGVPIGVVLLGAAVITTLLAPLAALFTVTFLGGGPRLRPTLQATVILTVTIAGVLLAFL